MKTAVRTANQLLAEVRESMQPRKAKSAEAKAFKSDLRQWELSKSNPRCEYRQATYKAFVVEEVVYSRRLIVALYKEQADKQAITTADIEGARQFLNEYFEQAMKTAPIPYVVVKTADELLDVAESIRTFTLSTALASLARKVLKVSALHYDGDNLSVYELIR